MNKWTTTELEYLKRHYNVMPIEQLAKQLERTEDSIVAKVYYLRKRGWTFHRRTDAQR